MLQQHYGRYTGVYPNQPPTEWYDYLAIDAYEVDIPAFREA